MQTNGNATTVDAAVDVLRLTEAVRYQSGSAFYTDALAIDADTSFSTEFKFQVGGGTTGADGFVFMLQGEGPTALGDYGGFLGYGNGASGDPRDEITSSLAIEFDTDKGSWDSNLNHVAVLVNGDVTDHKIQATNGAPGFGAGIDWNDGDPYWAWVDFDGSTETLSVYIAEGATQPAKPGTAVLTYDITTLAGVNDLTDIVGTQAYAGFSGGTGWRFNTYDILEWGLTTTATTTGLAAPVVTGIAVDTGAPGDGITSDNTLIINGTAEANAAVEVFLGAASLGDDHGQWFGRLVVRSHRDRSRRRRLSDHRSGDGWCRRFTALGGV